MVKRREIALIYEYNENWIGGTYYIQNLISALNSLNDSAKPALFVISSEQKFYDDLLAITGYPYLTFTPLRPGINVAQKIINHLSRKVFNKPLFVKVHKKFDLLFPAKYLNYFLKTPVHLYWIPDFQEHHLPYFFTKEEISNRKAYQASVAATAKHIVFSSADAQNDFNSIYPDNKLQQYLLSFAVTHPAGIVQNKYDLLKKYNLPNQYFICCNQFWEHKNHKVVLQAVAQLKNKGVNVCMVFTGKEYDRRNPDHFNKLKALTVSLGIEENTRFLGFISRTDQLSLIRSSMSLVQPSLCEGWSTSVEDAKSLQTTILASDLAVHHEQLKEFPNGFFFPALDEEALANLLQGIVENNIVRSDKVYSYEKEIAKFGAAFIEIVEEICN